jgi:dipeptidyl aminopeptidase/acylaminoacyl peptidase
MSRKLLVSSQRDVSGAEFDVLSIGVTASEISSRVDTVFSDTQMGDGMFEISPDGALLAYAAGPVESSLWMSDIDRTSTKRFAARQVLTSTTLLRGRLSPVGDRIFLAREVSKGGGRASQLSIISPDGGPETQLPGTVDDLLDYEWTSDGGRIIYLHGVGGEQVRLMETDTTGRRTREIARLKRSDAIAFQWLRDGAIATVSAQRRAISIIHRPGKRDVTWNAPDWISSLSSISNSPDGKSLAIESWDRLGDSVVVSTMEIETGRFTKLATFGGETLGRITWLNDGIIMFVYRETQGAYALFQIAPGEPARRLGTLPHTRATFSVSADGRHMAAFSESDKSDVFVIRNFGKMLQR